MSIEWDVDKLNEITPEVRDYLAAFATQVTGEANTSASGHYYAWQMTDEGVRLFRGSKRGFLVEFGTRAIQGGRHLKRALDKRRIR